MENNFIFSYSAKVCSLYVLFQSLKIVHFVKIHLLGDHVKIQLKSDIGMCLSKSFIFVLYNSRIKNSTLDQAFTDIRSNSISAWSSNR